MLIDAANTILAGHGRVAAAKLLGMATVPCVRLESMTPAQKRAYVIADNKLALNAGWDEDLLAEELKALLLADDLGFDIGVTGFSIAGDRRPGRGAHPGGARRPRGRLAARARRTAALPAGRCLAARAASADLRRRARSATSSIS